MRSKFDDQLDRLSDELITMGALCESAIASAVKSLLEQNAALAQTAIDAEKDIDRKEREIEALCLRLLLQQQPVAGDLRLISSALKMVTDMERIGDQAADVAGLVSYASLSGSGHRVHISDMSSAVIGMVTDSIDAFVRKDVALAEAVVKKDDFVDDQFIQIKKELIALIADNSENGETALDILMIAKYLERIGDHAVNIAGWVIFAITGRHAEEEL